MAEITDTRLKEMEEEMNRFEEEILGSNTDGGELQHHPQPRGHFFRSPHYPPMMQHPPLPAVRMPAGFHQTPMFIPPQLKHRPMQPPPRPPHPLGPMGHPPGGFHMGPFAPPVFSTQHPLVNRVPPPMFNLSPSAQRQPEPQNSKGLVGPSIIISAPKIVYSAPPVRNPQLKTEADIKKEIKPMFKPITSISVDSPFKPSTQVSKESEGDKKVMPQMSKVATSSLNKVTSQTVTKDTKPSTSSSTPSTSTGDQKKDKKDKKRKHMRMAAGTIWEDPTLAEWDTDDFRLFCGDLGNEVTDDVLSRVFAKFPSFQKARVIRDKRTNKTKGYGFASFKDPADFMKAMKELNGKYVGNRPIKLRKSCWQDRQVENVKRKEREKKKLGFR